MTSPAITFSRFWFASGRTLNLGLFRVVFACTLALEVSTSFALNVFAVEGGFHLSYFEFLPYISPQGYRWLHLAQYPLIAAIGLGIRHRVACAGLALLQGYLLFADRMNFRNHTYLFFLLLVLLTFAPASDAVSLRALWRSGASFWGSIRPLTAQRTIQLQICIVYFFAGASKLYPYYLEGHVLSHQLGPILPERIGGLLGERITRALMLPLAMQIAAWVTVLLELSLPFALWFPRTRTVACVAGIALHSALAYLLDVYSFSLVMMGSYLLFLDPEAIPVVVRRFFENRSGVRPQELHADDAGA